MKDRVKIIKSVILMEDKILDIPLNRGGKNYNTKNKTEIKDYTGNKIAEVSTTPRPIIFDSIKKANRNGFDNLHNIDIDELLEIIKEAGKKFGSKVKYKNSEVNYDQYQKLVTKTTGVPIYSVIKSTERLRKSFKNIDDILKSFIKFDLDILDRKPKDQILLSPKGRSVGVINPGNIPAPSFFWIIAQASKYPIIQRPSNSDPFTNYRIVNSLYNCGLPENSNYFLPTPKDKVSTLISNTDLGMIFGPNEVVNKFKERSNIKTFGPGNSKIFVDTDYFEISEIKDVIINSMMERGSRSCLNVSQLIFSGDKINQAKKFMQNFSDMIASNIPYKINDPLDRKAKIPCFPNHSSARKIESYLESDIEHRIANKKQRGELLVEKNNKVFLKPTISILEHEKFKKTERGVSHKLFREFPFPYLCITVVPREEVPIFLKNSLVASIFSEEESIIRNITLDPSIKKIHIKRETTHFNFKDPHEGNLINFLYSWKSMKEN